MTRQDETGQGAVQEVLEPRTPPTITSEEDAPFSDKVQSSVVDRWPAGENLASADDLRATITKFKYRTGARVLFAAMIAMAVFAVIDLAISFFPEVHAELISSAFEAFKLITMTVLGFIFGSNETRS